MKVSDIVKFVLSNRRNKVCKGWTPFQITYDISKAINAGTFAYVGDEGNITGVCWGWPDYINKRLHIDVILCTTEQAFKDLVQHFRTIYNGWNLTAERHNKFKTYNTKQFLTKI